MILENKTLLGCLIDGEKIKIESHPDLYRARAQKSPDFDWDKVDGMLLGLAIGDALGITTEGMLPSQRISRFSEVRDYLPNRYTGRRLGYPSDDTQLAFWTLEQLLEDRRFDPEKLAAKFSSRRIFGIGHTVKQFVANIKSGVWWDEAGPESAGNGSLMRIAPMVIPWIKSSEPGILADTALSAMLTHNDSLSISSCLSFVIMLWELLDMKKSPEPMWWIQRYTEEAARYELDDLYSPRGGRFTGFKGRGWAYVDQCVRWAWDNNLSVLDACNAWYSGAYLLETIPSAIYILMKHGHETEEAIIRAVNDTKDNDTIAAIVGAAVGALHGKSAIPRRWIDGLTGRTTDADEGKIFELLDEARRTFGTVS